uniref:Required for excision 1-B domain containing n=1 Tax=Takifugu rubripes TaxID=31033 RepID=A0A674MSN3_TAKRU
MRKPEKRRWLRHFLPTSSDIRLHTAEKCHMCVECKHNCVVNIGNLAIAFNVRTWGHEAYLRTGPHYDFDHYKQLVHEITQAFCGISKEVLGIKERLHHEFDRPDLSEHLEKLQNKEKQKLELTAMLQLARQQAQDHPEEDEHQERIQEVKQKIIKIKEDLSEIMQDFKFDCEE